MCQLMDDIKKKLSHTLSGPRRCARCRKMVYFSVIRCKQCGEVSHKHCGSHNCKATPGDCHSVSLNKPKDEGNPLSEEGPPSNPGVAMAGLLKIVRWLSHRKRAREWKLHSCEKHIRGRFGLNLKMEDKEARKKIQTLINNTQNYHRQTYVPGYCGQYQQQHLQQRYLITPESAVDHPRGSLSPPNSLSSPANTPETGAVFTRRERMLRQNSIRENDAPVSPRPSLSPKKARLAPRPLEGKTATLKLAKPGGLLKAKTLSIESRECRNESLCATWPPVGKAATILEEIVDENESECIEEAEESVSFDRSDSQSGEESLREWCIPFSDIEFRERIRHGRHGDIYRGRWYGEVLIHTIRHTNSQELNHFLDEVAQMGMIRHENIVLFMGACIEPQRLAVITSMRKGPTLFEYLHMKRHKLPFHSKHNIARQIAQGMGYLHAKGIVHKKLNSKNIILECRVKLCIMDHSIADRQLDRNDYGCIPRGHLSYISPELMSSLRVEPPRIFPSKPCTQKSDVYAFGSLLFELLAERFAFHDQNPHALIWQVATGRRASLQNFRFISGLKTLIKRCWAQDPEQRPPFLEIVRILQENVSHHRRHSCSEPDRLHQTGQTPKRALCT